MSEEKFPVNDLDGMASMTAITIGILGRTPLREMLGPLMCSVGDIFY